MSLQDLGTSPANQEPQLGSSRLRDAPDVGIHSLSGFMCGFSELLKVGINLVVLVMSFWAGEEDGGSTPFCEGEAEVRMPAGCRATLFTAGFFAFFFLIFNASSVSDVFHFWPRCRIREGLKRDWRLRRVGQ